MQNNILIKFGKFGHPWTSQELITCLRSSIKSCFHGKREFLTEIGQRQFSLLMVPYLHAKNLCMILGLVFEKSSH